MGFFTFLYDAILFTGTTAIGIFGAFFLTSQFVYSKTEAIMQENEERDDVIFEETYRKEFDSLEKKELPSGEILENFSSKVTTPLGDVVICYTMKDKSFNYYSDRRNIPVRFLDVVAQKFVIEHDCKSIYEEEENTTEEIPEELSVKEPEPVVSSGWFSSFFGGTKDPEEKREEDCKEIVETEPKKADKEDSVFATYKKNPEAKLNKNEMIEKIMNNYKYRGTLADFDDAQKKEITESLEISFSKFKEMVKNKTE